MTQTLPAVFFGHGSPMNALERNRYTEAWRTFGESIPRPRAILMVSAHWLRDGTRVTATAKPRTIYDFNGFPPELSAVRYDAPGAPEVAREVADRVGATPDTSWGLDHGTWSVLVHAFPKADVPVLQLSLDAKKSFAEHLELGARLAPLREKGILLAASGNVVHNLYRMNWQQPDAAFDWARQFDEEARRLMTTAPADVVKLAGHADYHLSVPTPEHFLPLLYIAGVAKAAGRPAEVLVDGYAMGSLSMTAYTVP
ncbi:MAG: 4,5-DOPA dioxygenase extradiol [Rhodospirillaceae bacterium]|nr:4,5-DOPA dioxygenase extradiol [Rhodospirillaceae bacterium]